MGRCWHIGRNYGSKNLFGRYGNRNSIAVEMCVQKGYDYETAFLHTVELVKNLMNETGIPSDAVYRHYDICSKNCPSQIQKRGDWERFQRLIRETEDGSEKSEYNPGIYRVTDPALNIRTGPGVEYPVVGVIKDQGSYTITEIRNKSWGRLLSGAGWINCHKAYCFYGGRV